MVVSSELSFLVIFFRTRLQCSHALCGDNRLTLRTQCCAQPVLVILQTYHKVYRGVIETRGKMERKERKDTEKERERAKERFKKVKRENCLEHASQPPLKLLV